MPINFSVAASVIAPSGNKAIKSNALALINFKAFSFSCLVKLAVASVIFFAGTLNILAVIVEAKSFKFLKFAFSKFTSCKALITSLVYCSFIVSSLAKSIGFICLAFGFVSISGAATSSAAMPLASSMSVVNSSPKILREASIALAGKNLFIYAANGTPESGLYSLIKSIMPRSPVSISSVNKVLSKLGAPLRFSTILFVMGLNNSIISNAPAAPCC